MIFNKILITVLMLLVSIGFTDAAPCEYDVDSDTAVSIGKALDDCLSETSLVDASDDIRVEEGFKTQVLDWTQSIAGLLGLLAVGAIVYGGLLMTISGGEDEKIKKGKDIVKWALIGFLGVLFAGVLVRIVVEVIFRVASI